MRQPAHAADAEPPAPSAHLSSHCGGLGACLMPSPAPTPFVFPEGGLVEIPVRPQAVQHTPAQLPFSRSKSWWCPQLAELRLERNRRWRRWKRTQLPSDKKLAYEARRALRRAICAAKRDEFPSEEVLKIWRGAEAFCLDVESVMLEDESVGELAKFLFTANAVTQMTTWATESALDYKEALALRLELMAPSAGEVEMHLRQHRPKMAAGMIDLIAKLQSAGKAVFLLSGGFRRVVDRLAESAGVPASNVYANTLRFDEDGNYAGFDEMELTCSTGGKARAIRHIKDERGYASAVVIGAEAADLEARAQGAAELFVGCAHATAFMAATYQLLLWRKQICVTSTA